MSHSQMLGKVEYGLPGLGYNGSNELLGRSVASKLSPQQADEFFHQGVTQIREKRKFFFGLQLENEERYRDGSNG